MRIIKENKKKALLVAVLAFVNAIAIAYYCSSGDTTSNYFGTKIYGRNPSCIAFYAIDCIVLWRFFSKEVLKNKRRIVTSCVLGLIFSYTALWGTHILYGTNAIFDDDLKTIIGLIAPLGFSLISTPIFSELIGLVDYLQDKNVESIGNKSDVKVDSEDEKDLSGKKIRIAEKANAFFDKNKALYFIILCVVFFLNFGILFLAYWPGSFSFDARYQLDDYLAGTMSTHHPILSTLLIGKAYTIGAELGNVNLGYSFYTMLQMFILASSFAFFMFYLKCTVKKRWVRVLVFCVFFFNPVNSLFAISTVKGVLCAAFTIYAISFLLFWISGRKQWINAILFVMSMILACQFRNNMIYAFVIAGAVIAFLQNGIRKKIILAVLVLSIFTGNKVLSNVLITETNATVPDEYRESMSVPLMCLSRVMINHKDEISESEFNRFTEFIPEYVLDSYSLFISDGIKARVDEQTLKTRTKEFIKLWVKYGLKYPGNYIEQITALTIGYWYPLDEPEFINGTTQFYTMAVPEGYEQIQNSNLTFIDDDVIIWLNRGSGRLMIPLFGWFWRGTIYFWSFAFGFAYSIYARKKETIFVIMIPFMYMLTCFFGPVSWLRYIYIDIACLPVLMYGLFASGMGMCSNGKRKSEAENNTALEYDNKTEIKE